LDKKLTEPERQQKREQVAEEARVRAQARADQLARTKEEKKLKGETGVPQTEAEVKVAGKDEGGGENGKKKGKGKKDQ